MLSLGILGSGKGSNFQSIMDAIKAGTLDARVVCVISDASDAYILERARREGIPAEFVDSAPYKTKLVGQAEDRVLQLLREYEADFVVLAGFMRLLKDSLLAAYPHRIVNIHPSLLPAFPGLESWRQALTYGVKQTGCTVHFIDKGMDTGPIITQRVVTIFDDDTPETLHARIQEQEHEAYPEALQWIAEDRLVVKGRRVFVKGSTEIEDMIKHPEI